MSFRASDRVSCAACQGQNNRLAIIILRVIDNRDRDCCRILIGLYGHSPCVHNAVVTSGCGSADRIGQR